MEAYMKAPQKVTLSQLEDMIDQWLVDNARVGEEQEHYHLLPIDGVPCGGLIRYYEAHMSVHDLDGLTCAGAGRVERLTLPICIKCCSDVPLEQGCIHPEPRHSAVAQLSSQRFAGLAVLRNKLKNFIN